MDPSQVEYVRRALAAYRTTPGTTGNVRPADRRLARELFARGVALQTVLDALLVATARRYCRAVPGSLPSIARSFHYFAPVIDELLSEPLVDSYRLHLRAALNRRLPAAGSPAEDAPHTFLR